MIPARLAIVAIVLSWLLGGTAPGLCASGAGSRPLERTNLLVYRNGDGALSPVTGKRQWLIRRAQIIQAFIRVAGPAPSTTQAGEPDKTGAWRGEKGQRLARPVPPEMRVLEQTNCGSYERRLITYTAEPGCDVPAYLLIPTLALQSKRKCPAVLALHPTDMDYGHRVLVEELRPHYRRYGHDLAELGFVVLAPAYPLMANYHPDLKALGYSSGTMKAIRDNQQGLNLLDSLPCVKPGKFGVIGHSLGGHNAIYTAVFDDRIKAVVTSCGFDSFVDYMDGKITGWTSERYMPGLLEYRDRLYQVPFDFHELLGALAPRPAFISAPLGDTNFKWRSVDEIVVAARPVYRLYGRRAARNLVVEHPDCTHDFPPEIRVKSYDFLLERLR